MARCKPRLSVDEAFDVLVSDRRRRLLCYLLEEAESPVYRDELARELATESELDPVSLETTLAHHHLPMLADVGIIEYDHRSGAVQPTEVAEELRPLLEAVLEARDSAK